MAENKETKKSKVGKEKAARKIKKSEVEVRKKTDKPKAENVKREIKEKKSKVEEIPESSVNVIHLRPLVTEKAVMIMEAQNVLALETSMKENKEQIKKEVEEIFNVKVESVRTLIRNGKKYAYVKLNPKDLAIDIATKLGMI